MSQSSRSQETVTRLKELLFERESRELDTLGDRIAELQKRAGSDEHFQHSVAKVLKGALEDVEKSSPQLKDVSDAMAPMVLRTLDRELKSQSRQDQIAGIIYPRLGEIVRSYVASAVRDMMETINRRLESGLGQNRFMLWLRSRSSGRSMAEQALLETQRLEIVEIYLVRRGSGELIHHWERREPGAAPVSGQGSNRDTLISGFLAAITAFTEEAFEADKEALRTVELGDHRLFIRGSPDHLLAAKCRGAAPEAIEELLDEALLHVLDEHQVIEREASEADAALLHEHLLGAVAADLDIQISERLRSTSRARAARRFKVLAVLVGLPLLVFAGWHYYVTWVTQDVLRNVNAALAEIPSLKGYPVRAHVEQGGNRIWVTGLVPDDATLRAVVTEVKARAPAAELTDAISVLPKLDMDARLGVEALNRAVDGARRKLGALATDLAAAQERVTDAQERSALTTVETTTRGAIGDIGKAGSADELGQSIQRAAKELRSAAEKIGGLAGIDVQWPGAVPTNSTDAAEAVTLAAERITLLVATLEQRRTVVPVFKQIDTVRERMAERIAELERRLEELRPPPPTPRDQLAAFVRGHALFFGSEADYRDPVAAGRTLDALAPLAKAAGVMLRVVGYTDEMGSAARNSPLAQARADRVTSDLVARGVPRATLIAVGRANGVNLAPGAGADSPNRRVQFEIAFDGERGEQP